MKSLNSIICLLFLVGCHASSEPKKLLSEEQMIDIITDFHFLEAKINTKHIANSDTTQFIFDFLKRDIFKKYNIDSTIFKQNYEYYAYDNERFLKIYTVISRNIKSIDSLEREKIKEKNQLQLYFTQLKAQKRVKDFRDPSYKKNNLYIDKKYVFPFY